MLISKNKNLQILLRNQINFNKNSNTNFPTDLHIQKFLGFSTPINKKILSFSKKNIHNLQIPNDLHVERTDKIYPKIRKYDYEVNKNEINLKFGEFLIFYENKKLNEALSKGYELLLYYETIKEFDIDVLEVIYPMIQISFEFEEFSQMRNLFKKAEKFVNKIEEFEIKENFNKLNSFFGICLKFSNEKNVNLHIEKIKELKEFPFDKKYNFLGSIVNSVLKISSLSLNKFSNEIEFHNFMNLLDEINNLITINNPQGKIDIDDFMKNSVEYFSKKIFYLENTECDLVKNSLIKLQEINKSSVSNLCVKYIKILLSIKKNDNDELNKFIDEFKDLNTQFSKFYLKKVMNFMEENKYISEFLFENKIKIISNYQINSTDNNDLEIFKEENQSKFLVEYFFNNFNQIKSNKYIETFIYKISSNLNKENQCINYLRNIINFSTFNLVNQNENINLKEKNSLDINDLFELKSISELINLQANHFLENSENIPNDLKTEFNKLNYAFNFKLSKFIIKNNKNLLNKDTNEMQKFDSFLNNLSLKSFIVNTFEDEIKRKNLIFLQKIILKDLKITKHKNKLSKRYLNFEDIVVTSFNFKNFEDFDTKINLTFSKFSSQIENLSLTKNENLIEKFIFSLFAISDSFYKLAYRNQEFIFKKNSLYNSNINYFLKYNSIKNNISYKRIDQFANISLHLIQFILFNKNEEIKKYLNNTSNENAIFLSQSIKDLQIKIFILNKYSEILFTNKSLNSIKESINKNRNFLLQDFGNRELFTEEIESEFERILDIINKRNI